MKICILAILAFMSFNASAWTEDDYNALSTYAKADPTANACIVARDDICLAAWFNTQSDFVVWRSSVSQDDIMQSPTFNWTRVDNLASSKARIWEWMFSNDAKTITPGNANIRAGIEAVWTGTTADLAVRASVYEICKRFANNLERAFVTGTGTTETPGLLVFEGTTNNSFAGKIIFRDDGTLR